MLKRYFLVLTLTVLFCPNIFFLKSVYSDDTSPLRRRVIPIAYDEPSFGQNVPAEEIDQAIKEVQKKEKKSSQDSKKKSKKKPAAKSKTKEPAKVEKKPEQAKPIDDKNETVKASEQTASRSQSVTKPSDHPASKKEKAKKEKKAAKKLQNSAKHALPQDAAEARAKQEERIKEFPILEKSFVKESITPQMISKKKLFVSEKQHNLNTILQRAVDISMPAQIAHERIQLSERKIRKAFRDFFTEAELSYNDKDGSLSGSPYQSKSWRTNFRQPLFRGGILWHTFHTEQVNRDAALKEYDQVVSDLVADVSRAYFEYVRSSNVLKDREVLLEKSKEIKRVSDEKGKANLISEIEKLNTDSLAAQVRYDYETAEQELELAKLELQKHLRLDISDSMQVASLYDLNHLEVVDIKGQKVSADSSQLALAAPQDTASGGVPLPLSQSVDASDVNRFIDLAYLHRPDLQVEALKLKSARLTHKISKGKFLPEADFILEMGQLGEAFEGTDRRFQGDLETTDPDLKNEFKIGAEMTWNAAGNTAKYSYDNDQRAPSVSQFQNQSGSNSRTNTFSLSILDNMNSLVDLKQTKIDMMQQVMELEKKERDVIREVKEAFYNYNKALIQLESSLKRLDYRAKLTELSKHRLDENEIQMSEYLQSEMDAAQERASVHKALADLYGAKASLNRAIGIQDYLRLTSSTSELKQAI